MIFNEAAREAAARAIWPHYEWWHQNQRAGARGDMGDALNAAVAALPERSKAILRLAELTDEELVERVARALALHEGYGLDAVRDLPVHAEEARVVLTALGLPVAEHRAAEGLRVCPRCNGTGDTGNESGSVCCDDCGGDGLAEQETTG